MSEGKKTKRNPLSSILTLLILLVGLAIAGLWLSDQGMLTDRGGTLFQTAGLQENPFQCITEQRENRNVRTLYGRPTGQVDVYYYWVLECQVAVDEVVIQSLRANRGNCSIENQNELYGRRLSFGETISIRTCVERLLELQVDTASGGSWTYSW